MKRRKSGGAYRKEKIILTASSVLVLTAMTVTGIYIYNSNQAPEPENNVVDFSALENSAQEKSEQIAQAQNSTAQNLTSGQDNSGELDYDPYYVEQERLLNEDNGISGAADAQALAEEIGKAEGVTDKNIGYAEVDREALNGQADGIVGAAGDGSDLEGQADGITGAAGDGSDLEGQADGIMGAAGDGSGLNGQAKGADGTQEGETESGAGGESQSTAEDTESAENGDTASAENGGEVLKEAVADVMQEEVSLHFSEDAKLQWPIVGNVLLNYSMDKTIYFPTLQQYKYNPSIVISATQGTSIACAANGVVKSIYKDPQTGTTVVMNLGDGYELSYGQLQDVIVEEGDFVEAGAFIAKVAAPTKYYTVEGTNVYFKLTKDGEPVNPMNYMG